MRASFLWVLSAALALVACGSEEPPCEAPDGCLAVSRIAGSCQCLDWKVVSDEIVPLKFLVTGVLATPPGNQSGVSYGDASLIGPGNPSGKSQLGTRLRAVLRDASGKRTVLSAEVPSVAGQGQYTLTALGGTTLAVGMAPGNGIGLENVLDIYPPTAHQVMVWVNPALRIARDAGGHVRGIWGWSGTCFGPPGANGGSGTCSAPNVFMVTLDQIAGNDAGSFAWEAAFLGTLTQSERAAIRAYDRFSGVPFFPTAAELDADPRFVRLAEVNVDPLGSHFPAPVEWTPCSSVARDEDFPVFATMEIPLSASESVLIEQSWLSTTLDCSTQTLGLFAGTSTPGCHLDATAYLDRMFGTLAFLPVGSRPACTVP